MEQKYNEPSSDNDQATKREMKGAKNVAKFWFMALANEYISRGHKFIAEETVSWTFFFHFPTWMSSSSGQVGKKDKRKIEKKDEEKKVWPSLKTKVNPTNK